MTRTAALIAAVLLLTAPVAAQVVNPTTVQFTPSADHSAVTSEGLPVVVRYQLRVYLTSDLAVPVGLIDLGKPPVGSDGTIQILFSALMPSPLPDGVYQARVVAIEQAGEGASDLSNVFARQASGSLLTAPSNVVIKT